MSGRGAIACPLRQRVFETQVIDPSILVTTEGLVGSM